MDKEKAEITIEELIEKERTQLDTSKLTKVTLVTFVAWKKKKLREKMDAEKKEQVKKKKEMRDGKTGGMSGRDMFLMDPSMLARHVEEDDGEDFDLTREEQPDDGAKVGNFTALIEQPANQNGCNLLNCFLSSRFMRSNSTSTESCKTALTSRPPCSWLVHEARSCQWTGPGLHLSTWTRIFSMTRIWTSWKMTWTTWKSRGRSQEPL